MSIGNLKTYGNKGNNFPWQLKMLEGLQAIADATSSPLTCVEDSVTICNNNIDALTFTGNALNVNIASGVTLEVDLDAANDNVGIYGYNGATPTPVSVDSNGFVNTNASVTFPGSLPVTQDPASNPWIVDATDLDIRDLKFTTDSVDVSGSSVSVSNFPATQPVSAASLPLPAGAATEATLLDVKTSVQLLDDCVGTDNTAAPTKSLVVAGVTSAGVQQTIEVNAIRTPSIIRTTANSMVSSGVYSVSFASVGTANATVGGVILKPGETINFDAGGINNTLAGIAYNASAAGAELLIIILA
jgi:hypothetical protein